MVSREDWPYTSSKLRTRIISSLMTEKFGTVMERSGQIRRLSCSNLSELEIGTERAIQKSVRRP